MSLFIAVVGVGVVVKLLGLEQQQQQHREDYTKEEMERNID